MEGTRYWGFDRSFTSVSYLINPGGGYFVNDRALEPFDHFSFYSKFRDDSEDNYVMVNRNTVKNFLSNPENFHLLDGWTVDGNPTSKKRPTTYMAYWNAIKNGWASGETFQSLKYIILNQSSFQSSKYIVDDPLLHPFFAETLFSTVFAPPKMQRRVTHGFHRKN